MSYKCCHHKSSYIELKLTPEERVQKTKFLKGLLKAMLYLYIVAFIINIVWIVLLIIYFAQGLSNNSYFISFLTILLIFLILYSIVTILFGSFFKYIDVFVLNVKKTIKLLIIITTFFWLAIFLNFYFKMRRFLNNSINTSVDEPKNNVNFQIPLNKNPNLNNLSDLDNSDLEFKNFYNNFISIPQMDLNIAEIANKFFFNQDQLNQVNNNQIINNDNKNNVNKDPKQLLIELNDLKQNGLITEEEYKNLRQEILQKL